MDTVRVRNTSVRNLCLTSGVVLPNDNGDATLAESQVLYEYIEVDPTLKHRPDQDPAAIKVDKAGNEIEKAK